MVDGTTTELVVVVPAADPDEAGSAAVPSIVAGVATGGVEGANGAAAADEAGVVVCDVVVGETGELGDPAERVVADDVVDEDDCASASPPIDKTAANGKRTIDRFMFFLRR